MKYLILAHGREAALELASSDSLRRTLLVRDRLRLSEQVQPSDHPTYVVVDTDSGLSQEWDDVEAATP